MARKSNKYAGDQIDVYDPTGVGKYLGLGRAVDFSDDINRIAILLAIIAAAAATGWETFNGSNANESALAGLGAGLSFAFSYLIALELDPDRKIGGIIAGILTTGIFFYAGAGNMLASLWLIFVLRMLSRTSGDRHRIGDNFILIGCGLWLGKDGYWLFPLLTGAAYILESQMPKGYYRSWYLSALAFASLYFCDRNALTNDLSLNFIYVLAAAFILFLPEVGVAPYSRALGDKNGKKLFYRRIQTAQGYFMITLFSIAFVHGNAGVITMMPGIMAALGCGIYLLVALLQHKVA